MNALHKHKSISNRNQDKDCGIVILPLINKNVIDIYFSFLKIYLNSLTKHTLSINYSMKFCCLEMEQCLSMTNIKDLN